MHPDWHRGLEQRGTNVRRPRFAYKIHAALSGHFWIPCPICGTPFSGWEWGMDAHTFYNAARTTGWGVCSARCAEIGDAGAHDATSGEVGQP
jgi:hypothetical protein